MTTFLCSYKTPEIGLKQKSMLRDGKVTVLIQNYEPSDYLNDLSADRGQECAVSGQFIVLGALSNCMSRLTPAEYLLFHFGSAEEIWPAFGPCEALDLPARCVRELIDAGRIPRPRPRA
jgi:hypothetical protein